MDPIGQDLEAVARITAKEGAALDAAGVAPVQALLNHLPRRYEDRRNFDAFPRFASAIAVCLRGTVKDAGSKKFGHGGGFFEAVVEEGGNAGLMSGTITLRWFNMPYVRKLLAAGQEIVAYGKVKDLNGKLVMDHPDFEIVPEDRDEVSIHLGRVVPIYRNIPGISQRRLREIIHAVVISVPGELRYPFDTLDAGISRIRALAVTHFPESLDQAAEARRRLALEEFFWLQLQVVWRKAKYREKAGRSLGKKTTLLTRFYHSLPFDLTDAQKRSIREIATDMREPRPMHRLLQGDVGSGKTFVAMAAMLLAIDSGCQAALMAPTQILAEQHFLTFKRWLEPIGIRLALRTGTRAENNHLDLEGPSQIVIGTHALFFDSAAFSDLGFVVIDEQHKFGVAQRAALVGRGVLPDVLVMTATPIPRTLTMTIYGDLDVSILDQKPEGRGKIVTAVRVKPKQTDVTRFVKDQLDQGRQAYLVYPMVEEGDTVGTASVVEGLEKWRKRLGRHEVGMIHGKLKPEEKERTMRRFREGELAALVATSVIEVGVDVPNATVMILHHAERFGLAQIHQLRGRVGRGSHKSYCVLLTDGKSPDALEKLTVLERSSDGFEIAEADLRLRGPGDVLGTEQSGLANLRFVEFLADTPLLREARALAEKVLAEDPGLDGIHRDLGLGAGGGIPVADEVPGA